MTADGEPSTFEENLRPYLELIANVGCFTVCYLALIPYFLNRKSANFFGSLLFFLCACAHFAAIFAVEAVARVFNTFGLLTAEAILGDGRKEGVLFFLFKTTAIDFIYVGGTILALDRFLAITFPVRYSPRCSRKLCFLAVLLSVATFAFIFVSFVCFPLASEGFNVNVAITKIGIFQQTSTLSIPW